MNKQRIQELALQSGAKLGLYVHNVSLLQPDGTYQWDEERHTDTTKINLEKFAELIVRECMSISSEAMTNGNWPPHMIAKHFGVDQ
jgi:hypothetical protein